MCALVSLHTQTHTHTHSHYRSISPNSPVRVQIKRYLAVNVTEGVTSCKAKNEIQKIYFKTIISFHFQLIYSN